MDVFFFVCRDETMVSNCWVFLYLLFDLVSSFLFLSGHKLSINQP